MNSSIKKHQSILRRIVSNNIPVNLKDKFNEKLENIEKKYKSTNLYLAIIGEFSSGKSTFINAILRERLLKEAVMPTTASATYLSKAIPDSLWQKILGNSNTNLRVTFCSGESFNVNESKCQDLQYYLKNQFNVICENIYEIITSLTSDQKVALKVSELYIYLKNNFLPKKITLIDTPGFNPGEEMIENHLEITRNVVENIADLAVVLIPSNQAMSRTLTNFLETNLKKYLHRCIFVITKMDEVNAKDRQSLVRFVSDNLKKLGVSNPELHTLSAWTMLPVKNIPYQLEYEWNMWKDAFVGFENHIWNKLDLSRDIVISEHTLRLLETLIVELHCDLKNTQNNLKNTIRILEDNTVLRIQDLTYKVLNCEKNRLLDFYKSISIYPEVYIKTSIDKSFSLIATGGKLKNFKSLQGPQIEQIIKEQIQCFVGDISNQQSKSKSIIDNAIVLFRKEFDTHYKDMPSLNPNKSQNTHVNQQYIHKVSMEDASSVIAGEQFKYASKTVGVAAVGAGIGTLIMPGIGTLLGGIIGGIAGFLGFGPNENEIQMKVKIETEKYIRECFGKVKNAIDVNVDQCRHDQVDFLDNYCQAHVIEYGKKVEILINQQTNEKNVLNKKILEINSTIKTIDNIKNEIEDEVSILKMR